MLIVLNVLSIQSYYVSDLIVWCRVLIVINLLNYMFLSVMNVLLTFSFKHSHFVNKGIYQFLVIIWCVCGLWFIENFSSKMGCEIFDDYKQCSADDWMKWIVVGKLDYENLSELINLKSISLLLKIKLQKLINVFCLIICFQVKDNWELNINVHVKTYLFLEITDKLKVIIWYNKVKSIVFLIELSESDVAYTDSINLSYRHKCNIFKKIIHNNHHIDANLLINVNKWRQISDKINCKMLESLFRYWQGH